MFLPRYISPRALYTGFNPTNIWMSRIYLVTIARFFFINTIFPFEPSLSHLKPKFNVGIITPSFTHRSLVDMPTGSLASQTNPTYGGRVWYTA